MTGFAGGCRGRKELTKRKKWQKALYKKYFGLVYYTPCIVLFDSVEERETMAEKREMNADFSRVLGLLRQEKGISQRKAAADLGISQALLSHYENGIREPGLGFVARACDYYHVSADYLLGRSHSRDGAMIEAEELVDASEGKESLKGSIQAKLQKKLVVNTASVLFDLLGQVGSGEAVGQAGAYLSSALYQLFRQLYRSAGGNEGYFSTDSRLFDMDVLAADMTLARIRYANALEAYQGEYPAVDDQSLAESYQGLAQAVAQVFHNTDERVRGLGISDAQQG